MVKKRSHKVGRTIPELEDVIAKYGCSLGNSPPYIVFGQFNSKTAGPFGGILAAATNQFHAYLILREVRRHGNKASVERTEFHPRPTFYIERYKEQLREKLAAQKKAELDEKRQAQYPRPRIVSWGSNAAKKEDTE